MSRCRGHSRPCLAWARLLIGGGGSRSSLLQKNPCWLLGSSNSGSRSFSELTRLVSPRRSRQAFTKGVWWTGKTTLGRGEPYSKSAHEATMSTARAAGRHRHVVRRRLTHPGSTSTPDIAPQLRDLSQGPHSPQTKNPRSYPGLSGGGAGNRQRLRLRLAATHYDSPSRCAMDIFYDSRRRNER